MMVFIDTTLGKFSIREICTIPHLMLGCSHPHLAYTSPERSLDGKRGDGVSALLPKLQRCREAFQGPTIEIHQHVYGLNALVLEHLSR